MLLALLVSTALVLAAPFIGEFRRWLAATVPGQYVWIINGVVGVAAAAVVLTAVVRIRSGRVWRFGLLGLATRWPWVCAVGRQFRARCCAVEHFHFVKRRRQACSTAWRARGVASLVPPSRRRFGGRGQWFRPRWELQMMLSTVPSSVSLVSVALAPVPASPRGSWFAGVGRRVRDCPHRGGGVHVDRIGYAIHDEESARSGRDTRWNSCRFSQPSARQGGPSIRPW
jgi:hypothetical protein